MKNMIYSKWSKLDFSLVWSSIYTAHITLDVKSSSPSPQRIISLYIIKRFRRRRRRRVKNPEGGAGGGIILNPPKAGLF